jgi:Domain of unknown function (DUF4337)
MLKDKDGRVLTRSEGESIMKSRSSVVVSICAAVLAITVMLSNSNSSKILNDTLNANDMWAFYQSKSIKQDLFISEAERLKLELRKPLADVTLGAEKSVIEKRISELNTDIQRYESNPATGDGKRELMAKAKEFEHDRADAKKRSLWYGAASAALQIAIVLCSSSILAVSMPMLVTGGSLGLLGLVLLINAVFSLVVLPL